MGVRLGKLPMTRRHFHSVCGGSHIAIVMRKYSVFLVTRRQALTALMERIRSTIVSGANCVSGHHSTSTKCRLRSDNSLALSRFAN